MFDVKEYFLDVGATTAPSTHKHSRRGWKQIECPFCTGNPGYHLGFNMSANFFNCWRCGWHSILEVISKLSQVTWESARQIYREYDTGEKPKYEEIKKGGAKAVKLPRSYPLDKRHIKYLKSRKFNPEQLIDTWDLRATGPIGKYSHRIIAPIYLNDFLVSYQCRDWTGKSSLRYKACEIKDEVVHHKHLLYGIDKATSYRAILVEGITDVWRLGPGAIATFGIEVKNQQIMMLAERFSKVFIMFDDDPQAVKRAEEIGIDLSMMGVETEICLIKGDPGKLPQKIANQYKKELIGV